MGDGQKYGAGDGNTKKEEAQVTSHGQRKIGSKSKIGKTIGQASRSHGQLIKLKKNQSRRNGTAGRGQKMLRAQTRRLTSTRSRKQITSSVEVL